MSILQLKNISKSFGAIKALDDVSLSLNQGEVLGLMGDNGAGKSTLVKIIAGNFKPSSGNIVFEDEIVEFNKPMDAREKKIEVVYKVIFCLFAIIGSSLDLLKVIELSDAALFLMAIPNLIGVYMLASVVKKESSNYFLKLNEHKASK